MEKLNDYQLAHESADEQSSPAAQMLALSELERGASADGEKILERVNPLHHVRTRLMAVVGQVEMTVGELMAAKEHQVVRLDSSIDQAIDLLLDGRVVARGQLVAVDENFAVRITELPIPLKV